MSSQSLNELHRQDLVSHPLRCFTLCTLGDKQAQDTKKKAMYSASDHKVRTREERRQKHSEFSTRAWHTTCVGAGRPRQNARDKRRAADKVWPTQALNAWPAREGVAETRRGTLRASERKSNEEFQTGLTQDSNGAWEMGPPHLPALQGGPARLTCGSGPPFPSRSSPAHIFSPAADAIRGSHSLISTSPATPGKA